MRRVLLSLFAALGLMASSGAWADSSAYFANGLAARSFLNVGSGVVLPGCAPYGRTYGPVIQYGGESGYTNKYTACGGSCCSYAFIADNGCAGETPNTADSGQCKPSCQLGETFNAATGSCDPPPKDCSNQPRIPRSSGGLAVPSCGATIDIDGCQYRQTGDCACAGGVCVGWGFDSTGSPTPPSTSDGGGGGGGGGGSTDPACVGGFVINGACQCFQNQTLTNGVCVTNAAPEEPCPSGQVRVGGVCTPITGPGDPGTGGGDPGTGGGDPGTGGGDPGTGGGDPGTGGGDPGTGGGDPGTGGGDSGTGGGDSGTGGGTGGGGSLYRRSERTMAGVLAAFTSTVSKAPFYRGAIEFFKPSIPGGSCSGLSGVVTYQGHSFVIDMDGVFCSSAAVAMYSLMAIAVMLGATWAAYRVAIL